MSEARHPVEVTDWEHAKLIDALMVLMHQMTQIPQNDLSEMPQLQALLDRLMEPAPWFPASQPVKP